METKMRETFEDFVERTGVQHRGEAITEYQTALARGGNIKLLDYVRAHEPELRALFQELGLRHTARSYELLRA